MSRLDSLFGEDAAILRERNFQTLLLANVLPPLGAAVVSPILDSLIAPFGTTAADIGLMMSAFTAPAVVLIPVAGALSDRYGRKPVLVGALMCYGVAGAAIAYAPSFRVALALRALQGVGFGGITPVIITSLGDLYEGTAEATAQGIRFTGSGLTQTVAPLLAGGLVVVAWQFPFLLYAAALPVAAVVAVWFEEPVSTTRDVTTPDGGERNVEAPTLVGHLRQRRVVALLVARGLPLAVWIGFITYNSLVVSRVHDGSPTQAGLLVALGSLAYATASSQTGRVTAAFDSRHVPLVAANLTLAGGFVGFLFAPGLVSAAASMLVSGLGFGIALSLYRSIVTGLAGEELRGTLVSLAEAFGRLVATVTPVAMGGVVAVLTPQVELAMAIRIAGVGAAVVSGVGGVLCVSIANASPPVRS